MDPHRHVHAGDEREALRVRDTDLDGDHMRDLLEVPGRVGLRERREHPGRTALHLEHGAGERHAGEGVDGDVDGLADAHLVDRGLVRPRGDVELREVVGHGELRAGRDERALHPVVDHDGRAAWRPDRLLQLHEPALDADPPEDPVLLQLPALGRLPVDQGAAARRVDDDLVAVDLGVVGAHVPAGIDDVDDDQHDRGDHRDHPDDQKRDACGALQLAARRHRGGRAVRLGRCLDRSLDHARLAYC